MKQINDPNSWHGACGNPVLVWKFPGVSSENIKPKFRLGPFRAQHLPFLRHCPESLVY